MADTASALEVLGCAKASPAFAASETQADTSAQAAAMDSIIQVPSPLTADPHYAPAEISNDSTLRTLNDFLDFMGVDAHGSGSQPPRGRDVTPTIYAANPRPLLRRDTFLLPSTSSATSQALIPAAAQRNFRTDSASYHDQPHRLPQDRIPSLFYQCSTPRQGHSTGGGSRRGRRKLLYSGCTPSPGKDSQTIEAQHCTLTRVDSSHFPAPDFARSSSYAVSMDSPAGASTLESSPNRKRRSLGPSPPHLPTVPFAVPYHGSQMTGRCRVERNSASYRFLPSDGSSLMGQHLSSDSNDHYATAASIAETEGRFSYGGTPANFGGEETGLTSGLRAALNDEGYDDQTDGAVASRYDRAYRYSTPPSPSPKRLLVQHKALRLVSRQQAPQRGGVQVFPQYGHSAVESSARKPRPTRKLSTGVAALADTHGPKRLKARQIRPGSSQLQAEVAPISSNTAAEILFNLHHTSSKEVSLNGERMFARSARSLRAEQRAQILQKSVRTPEMEGGYDQAGEVRRLQAAPQNGFDTDEPGLLSATGSDKTSGLASPRDHEDAAAQTATGQGPDEEYCKTQLRIFPRHVDKQEARFPGFYQRYTVPSQLPEEVQQKVFPRGAKDPSLSPALQVVANRSFFKFPGDPNLSLWDPFDLYIPRFTRGRGMKKEALCPICYDSAPNGRGHTSANWYQTKVSAYNYHLQITHGIMPATGQPMDPPVAFRSVDRVGNAVATGERKTSLQGECHACGKWIALESVKDVEVKIPEIYWRKHAAKCHKKRPMAGTSGVFVEDEFYIRVKAAYEAEAE